MHAGGNDRWTGSFTRRRAPAAGSSRSRRGSTASRRSATSSGARSRRARPISPASSRRARRCSGCRARRRGGARLDRGRPLARRPRLVRTLDVDVDRELARFGAWYELFPRSWGGFAGVEKVLPRAGRGSASTSSTCRRSTRSASRTARAGTTRRTAEPGDPGSPWAIGSAEGGHTAVDPELGTIEDFERLVARRGASSGRDRARLRDPVLARPPVAAGAPRVVPPPPRRDAQVRREPAQALPGHLQRQLRQRGLAGRCGRRCATSSSTGSRTACRCFRVDNPHTKPVAVLGVADPRGARGRSRRRSSSPRRSRGRR